MKQIAVGSTVQVTGICILEDSNPFDSIVPFDVMMRSYDDIAVIAQPSLLTIANLVLLLTVMRRRYDGGRRVGMDPAPQSAAPVRRIGPHRGGGCRTRTPQCSPSTTAQPHP